MQKVGGRATEQVERRRVRVEDQRGAILQRGFQRIKAQEEIRQLGVYLERRIHGGGGLLSLRADAGGLALGGSKFSVIESNILSTVQTQLKANSYGIEVQFVGLKRLGLPDAVTATVFERMKSEREVLSRRYESEGQAEADKIRAKANSDAAKTLAAAESEATRIRAQGQKAAAAVYPTFQQNPELANFLLRLDALEASLKDRATLIFDANTPPFDLFRGASTNLLHK